MKRIAHSALAVELCLCFAVAGNCQSRRTIGDRTGDPSTAFSRIVTPDSPGTSSIVVAGPQAVIPRLMKFSGALHDASGKPLSGTVDVTFALYNTEAGGTPLWFETQSVQTDDLGRYTALLGAMHTDGLPIELFTSGEVRWLGIQVGLEAEQSRVLLVSVPYALKAGDAETLGGKPASAYMLSEAQSGTTPGATTTTSTAQAGTSGTTKKSRTANTSPLTPVCASMTSNTGGTANYIAMFDGACDAVNSSIIQSGANVGIGTATPGSLLHMVGNNSTLTISGTGTHQVNIVGATSGRLGQDAVGFFFSSDTNGAPIRFATNNGSAHEWMRITSAGNVGIGTSTPAAKLDVAGNINTNGGVTAYSVSASGGSLAISGIGLYDGVYGQGTAAGGTSFGYLGTGVTIGQARYAAGVYGNSPLYGVYGTGTGSGAIGVYGNVTGSGATGVYGAGSAIGVQGAGSTYGVYGSSDGGTGVYGTSGSNNGVYGYSSTSHGVMGQSGYLGVLGTATTYGVYGQSANYGVYSGGPTGASGTKSAVVALQDDRVVELYVTESPEVWFEDFGTATLKSGVAEVTFDPTFALTVNTQIDYHVFLTPNGDCEGLFVAEKTTGGFRVRELRSGKSNISFDYRIVAKRRGFESVRLQEVETDTETTATIRKQNHARATRPVLHIPKNLLTTQTP